jgi:putative transposase
MAAGAEHGDAGRMARLPRFDLPGVPQHVVQRGNNRLPCFLDDDDRQRYLQCLRQALLRFGCRLHAYVLMSNHVHPLKKVPGTISDGGGGIGLRQKRGQVHFPSAEGSFLGRPRGRTVVARRVSASTCWRKRSLPENPGPKTRVRKPGSECTFRSTPAPSLHILRLGAIAWTVELTGSEPLPDMGCKRQ